MDAHQYVYNYEPSDYLCQQKLYYIGGLSGEYPSIFSISRNVCVTLIQLGGQSEETLLCIHD